FGGREKSGAQSRHGYDSFSDIHGVVTVLNNPSCFLLFDLLAGLAFHSEGGYRTSLETLDSDLFSTFLTDTIIAVVQPPQRLLNFEDQLAFTVANTQDRVSI